MPAIGANNQIQRGARLPGAPVPKTPKAPPPKAPPPIPTNLRTGATPRGVAIVAPAPKPTVNDTAARTLTTGANPRGVAIAQRPAGGVTLNQAHYQAVRDTFAHQKLSTQVKIVQGIQAGKADRVTTRAVASALKALPADHQHAIAMGLLNSSGTGLGKILGAINPAKLFQNLGGGPVGGPASGLPAGSAAIGARTLNASSTAARALELAPRAAVDVGRAAVEDPSVVPKTIKGLGETALGGTAALAELPVKAVENGPGQAFGQLFHGLASDYKARYGPLMAGNDQAFINRIKKQGAGSEALDALGLVGGVDATAGRVLSTAAKLGGEDNILTRARPALRVAGGESRPQELAPTAGRALAQRSEDALRRLKERKLPGEIGTDASEVRPLFGNRSQRVLTSHVASKYRNLMARVHNTEVRTGAHRSLSRLSSAERRAAPIALEGEIPLRSGERAATDAIDARMNRVQRYRTDNPKSTGNHIPAENADTVDELRSLQWMRDNVSKWLTPRLAKFVDEEGQRNIRIENKMPDSFLRKPVAEARRLRAQGEALGVEHPDEIAARGGDLTRSEEMGGKAVLGSPQSIKARALQEAEVAGRRGAHHPIENEPARTRAFGSDLQRARNMERSASQAEMLRNYDELRPGLLQDYSARVRAAREGKGLPEPSFFHHTDIPGEKLGDYASGMGHRAMPGAKHSKFELYKSGAVSRDPRVYTAGLARSIKVGHQWRMVDEMMRRAALPEPSAAAIKAAGFGRRRADTLTAREYVSAMQHDGHELANLRLYNPGRLRESTMIERGLGDLTHRERMAEKITPGGARSPAEDEAGSLLHQLVADASQDPRKLATDEAHDEAFLKTAGWKALPPTAFDEIHSSLQPSGLGGRLIGKIQGTAAHLILGGSPSFLAMNTLAHMLLATFGTRGRLLTDAAKMPFWWHGLSEEERGIVDAHAGGRVQARTGRLGSTTPRKIADSWETLKQKGIGRFTVGHVTTLANPFHALFKAEDLQSHFFRRTVFYNATKRAALNSMAKDMGHMASAMNRLEHVFKVGPKDQMLAQLSNMHTVEELGRYTVNAMGDYTRFTSGERRFLNNRAVLFYSFMRHATRTLFYVLPVKHPIATALVGELANLHNEEVKKLLGGADLPYADSRLYFDKNGKLTSIDFERSSPIGSFGVDLPTEGIGGLAQVIPPEAQPFLNAIYGQNPTGGAYKPNALSLLNSFLQLSYPARLATELHDGTQLQQSDSIPFIHDDPQTRKTAKAQAYQAAKEAASGPLRDKVLASLLGLYPKPDDIGVIAGRQNQQTAAAAARAAGGGSGWGFQGGAASNTTAATAAAPPASSGWGFAAPQQATSSSSSGSGGGGWGFQQGGG